MLRLNDILDRVSTYHPDPDLDLINTTDPIDFSLSAFGPKGREAVAELGVTLRGAPDISALIGAAYALDGVLLRETIASPDVRAKARFRAW